MKNNEIIKMLDKAITGERKIMRHVKHVEVFKWVQGFKKYYDGEANECPLETFRNLVLEKDNNQTPLDNFSEAEIDTLIGLLMELSYNKLMDIIIANLNYASEILWEEIQLNDSIDILPKELEIQTKKSIKLRMYEDLSVGFDIKSRAISLSYSQVNESISIVKECEIEYVNQNKAQLYHEILKVFGFDKNFKVSISEGDTLLN